MKLICVLRTGGDFEPVHVARLLGQWAAHAPAACEFVCLTDHPNVVGQSFAIPLEHGWPSWWSKIEALRIHGPALLMDLDVSVVGDLAPLCQAAAEQPLVMCRGFWGAEDPNPFNSSVIGWSGDVSAIYRAFAASPAAHMSVYAKRDRFGDQSFIKDHSPYGPPALWQELLPGKLLSFKRDVLTGMDRRDARIVVSHGKPRPWALDGADRWLSARAARQAAQRPI